MRPARKYVPTRRVLGCAWPALVLATVCLLPFLNKAFLIDDPHFLAMARQILKSPLHPMNFDICWNIVPYCMKAYELTPGNTLMGYALVPTVLGGAREWIAHITQLVFVWIAAIAMASFVLRMGWGAVHAVIGALLLVATPPLLPMASTAMPDVLALTVGLVGMERLAAWKQDQKWHQGAAAAFGLGLAGIARAHLVLLLPLGAFFLMDSTKPREVLLQIRRSLWLWVPVLAGALVLVMAILATRERGLMLNPTATFVGLNHIRANLHSYLLFFCFPLPLATCWAAARWHLRRNALMILSATTIGLLVAGKQLVLVLIGGYVLADLLWDAWKSRERTGLFLGLWLLVPLPIVYYGHFPIKYLLPCLPAIILIYFGLGSAAPAWIAHTAGVLLIIGGTAYSLFILRADAEFADFGRTALSALIRPHVLAGEKVWFPEEFSAYWYAPGAGAELVIPGVREPQRGDLLAVGTFETDNTAPAILRNFPNRTLVQALRHKYRFGRTMGEGAGLYNNNRGNWLWTFRNGEHARYELWRLD
jgi:hypothetical protein